MINALICSSKINLSEWESYVISRANQAQSIERRWHRFVHNSRVKVKSLYIPLVMAAISEWNEQRLYLAIDTTVLWNRYCMIHLSVICGGRAIPLMWKVMEHKSSTVAFKEYKLMLRLSHRLLFNYCDVMLLADRGFANHQLISWLKTSQWHYCLRFALRRIYSWCEETSYRAKNIFILPSQKRFCIIMSDCGSMENVAANFVLANVKGVKEPWAVITDEDPTLQSFMAICHEISVLKSCFSILNLECSD